MKTGLTAEQEARGMLCRMGVVDAQAWTTGDVAELAKLIADRHTAFEAGRQQGMQQERALCELAAEEQAMEPPRAIKVGGSYQAEGWIVARFKTRGMQDRVVFEFAEPAGMLHIFDVKQVEEVKP